MPRKKQQDIHACPVCGNRVEKPVKTWQLISPLPDSKGRITITVMGFFECSKCGNRWRGVVSKVKAGGSTVEISGKGGTKVVGEEEEKPSEPYTIEIDIDEEEE